ncbi:MAG: ABC transporter permease [Pyrinomonadaceae bacterium]
MRSLVREVPIIMWRESRFLMRNPVPIVLGFVNPILWLLLFGSVFYNLARFPGFPAPNYITFLVPGILAMNAVARGLISCFNIVWHRYYGFLDKILVTPISRTSIFLGQLTITVLFGSLESILIMSVGWLMGLKNASGFLGVLLMVVLYVSLQLIFIAISMMMIRMIPEQFIGMLQLLILPPVFLSSALFPLAFAPKFIRVVAKFNPLTHAVEAMRIVLIDGLHWKQILFHWGIVIAVAIAALLLAHRLFVRGISKHNS